MTKACRAAACLYHTFVNAFNGQAEPATCLCTRHIAAWRWLLQVGASSLTQ